MKDIVKDDIDNVELANENEHIVDMQMWESLDFNIDENYKYIPNGKIFEFFSNLIYYGIAVPVLYFLTRVMYDLKIEGKENIRNLEEGAVSVSNHVLILDCAMVRLSLGG